MNNYEYAFEKVHLSSKREKQEVEDFLKRHELILDQDVETCFVLRSTLTGKIVATASAAKKVLKCFAVDSDFQGEGFSNRLISELIHEQAEKGHKHLFVFTKPENTQLFESLGFYPLASVPNKVVLLENNPKGLQNFLTEIAQKKKEGNNIASIVVNCNPFTLGHQYLIETAAKACDVLHLFVVWEDASIFPNAVRLKLIQEGTAHLSNVILHKGHDYIISQATFPTYFIKSAESILETHARLDLEIFSSSIAPTLGIKKRYVGNEPYCLATNTYNRIMKEFLPTKGIELIEIARKEYTQEAISASRVRQLIREDKLNECQPLVPLTTWNFLNSDEAKPIIHKIKTTQTRH